MNRVLFVIAVSLQAQTRPDTQALATSLQALRGTAGPSKEQFRSIQDSFLKWVNVRLAHRDTVDKMNDELREAGALDLRPPAEGFPNYTGFLDNLRIEPTPGEFLAIRLGIGTTCSYDETVVVYQRQPWKRLGWLNHGDLKDGVGYVFSSFQVGRRLIAATLFDEWCTSTLIRLNFRIVAIEGASMKTLLNRDLDGRRGFPDWKHPASASIEGDQVNFRYVIGPGGHISHVAQRYAVTAGGAKQISK